MILFTILLVTFIVFAIAALISAIIGGISIAVAFGDIIVFGLIVWMVVKILKRKKNKK